jgi:hypothetical protein
MPEKNASTGNVKCHCKSAVLLRICWSSRRIDLAGPRPSREAGNSMQGKTRERWQELCEQAANEQDPAKMLAIVEEINRLLSVKYDRLSHK